MAKVQTMYHSCNGHTLIVRIIRGKRYFECPALPDLAERFNGCADASEALDEFERRVTTGMGLVPPITTEG